MDIGLSHGQPAGEPFAELGVEPGGGSGSVRAHASPGGYGTLPLSPRVGDQLALSIYYDRHGHDYFTANDLTQHITRTVRLTVGNAVYNHGFVIGVGGWPEYPPQADTRMLEFTGSHVTTYTGAHGTLTGPWATWQYITTSSGTVAGTVIASPSGLWNGEANFGVWLRAVPVTYTSGFAGYTDGGGPFRFAATTMTVPPAQTPAANGGTVLAGLGHNGGPTPRPYANIEVLPGGGAGSISYDSTTAHGTFTVNPKPGDQLRVRVYYDRNGHYSLAATDTTTGDTQTITVAAPSHLAGPLPAEGIAGLEDRSHQVHGHPWRIPAEVEEAICELRRTHPKWGPRRLVFEMGRRGQQATRSTVYRTLVRNGLVEPKSRRRRRKDHRRWQRGAAGKIATVICENTHFRVVIDGETAAVVPRTTTSEVHRYKANATDKRTQPRPTQKGR